jgi:Flp pilus assembly protein TadD
MENLYGPMVFLWPYAAAAVCALGLGLALMFLAGPGARRHAAAWRYTTQLDEARKLIRQRQYDEAEELLEPLTRKSDAPVPVFAQLAIIVELRGNVPYAMRRWKRLIKAYPDSAVGYAGLARLLNLSGAPEKAERLLIAARKHVTHVAALTNAMATAATQREEWDRAIALWEQVRSENASDVDAYLLGRICLLAVGRVQEANELLATASMLFPRDPRVIKANQQAS